MMGAPKGMTREQDPIRRTRLCGWCRISTNVTIELEVGGPGPLLPARYAGLVQCGAIHVCPVCSANIRHQRALEVGLAARAHLEAGGSLVMLTLTVPHSMGMPLVDLWTVVQDGWHACNSGRRAKRDRDRWGMVGYVRAIEVTHGSNGWHPHLHVLLFLGPTDDHEQLASDVQDQWYERWAAFITGRGHRAPSRAHGVDARAVTNSSIGDYLVKVQEGDVKGSNSWGPAQEMARADLKRSHEGNVTPFGLIRRYSSTGDLVALAAWREWETSSKGRRVLTWSRGLKDRYGVVELSDQQAAERLSYETLALYHLCAAEWDAVRFADGDLTLLEEASMGGREAVEDYLRDLLGIDQLSCGDCLYDHDGLRIAPCHTCGDRLDAAAGRNLS